LTRSKDELRQWLAQAQGLRLAHDQASFESAADLRNRLAELWLLVDNGPPQVHTVYRELPERAIELHREPLSEELVASALPWSARGDAREVVLSIAGAMRALDAKLTTLPQFRGKPVSGRTLLAEDTGVYVIPRGRPKHTDRQEGPGNCHLRRAAPNHNLVPRELPGGYEVEVLVDAKLSLPIGRDRPIAVGAALFPDQHVEWDKADEGWIALEADTGRDEELIRAQVEGAYTAAPFAAVWPELSMPERRRTLLQQHLQRRSDGAPPLSGPRLVAAGSWHDPSPEGPRNVMRILDGTGEERLSFAKISRFIGGGVREGNEPDRTIKVLWTQECLVSFAICSDFCDLSTPEPPFLRLDVDLLLVPSLGTPKALKGHEANRERRRIITAGETVVVQQQEGSHDPQGWVLPEAPGSQAGENRAWSIREVDLG